MRPAQTLLFDLDNTLVHSELAYDRALARVGLAASEPAYLTARKAVKERLPDGHVCARNRLLYFKALLELRGEYSPGAVLAKLGDYETALGEELSSQWLRLNRSSLLNDLAAKYSLVVVTNENLRTQLVKLRAVDPGGRIFSKLVTSEEVGVEKPDFRIFNVALKTYGLQPSACIMIGDSVTDDVAPARALGMQTVLTREFTVTRASHEGVEVSKLEELRGLLLT